MKQITKSDLETGMHVITRAGDEYIVIRGYGYGRYAYSPEDIVFVNVSILKGVFSFNDGDDYDENLRAKDDESVDMNSEVPDNEYDVVQVYAPMDTDFFHSVFDKTYRHSRYTLVYDRNAPARKIKTTGDISDMMKTLAEITKTITEMYEVYADERPKEN